MTRKTIPRATRRAVRERANHRCEYCQHPDTFACGPFACEHVLPRVEGAGDNIDELAWSYAACNGHKYKKTKQRDPISGRLIALFNPRHQRWARHFQWSDDSLLVIGRTATGRATVEALQLNRAELINLRFALSRIGEHRPRVADSSRTTRVPQFAVVLHQLLGHPQRAGSMCRQRHAFP